MTTPFKLGCHCGFLADDPQAFLDHILTTQHIALPEGATESGALAELQEMFAAVQASAANPDLPLPEGAELRELTMDDILEDDELPDDVKQEILARFEAIQEQRRKKAE